MILRDARQANVQSLIRTSHDISGTELSEQPAQTTNNWVRTGAGKGHDRIAECNACIEEFHITARQLIDWPIHILYLT